MADLPLGGAAARLLKQPACRDAFDLLVSMPGADLTSFQLAIAAARAERLTTADVIRQRQTDRFVAPSTVDALAIARAELHALETVAKRFDPIALAPMAPLGAHRALGNTAQNNVVTTSRLAEVTADPTNSLAIEAALRRKAVLHSDPRSATRVRLAAAHRVTRAQRFEGPQSFAHFSLLGLVTAGRDQGGFDFELESLIEQITTLVAAVQRQSGVAITIRLTAFNERLVDRCARVCTEQTTRAVAWSLDQSRTHGRGYYQNVCFKLHVLGAEGPVEIGDGGDVDWTQALVQSRKERLSIAGLGLDRLALHLERER